MQVVCILYSSTSTNPPACMSHRVHKWSTKFFPAALLFNAFWGIYRHFCWIDFTLTSLLSFFSWQCYNIFLHCHFLKIDEDTLRDVVNMGFNKNHVCESLCSRLQNEVWTCIVSLMFLLVTWLLIFWQIFQATVAYYLLLDNRFRATSGYLGADYQESMVSTH